MILITGGSGYLGSRVLGTLTDRALPVTAIENRRPLSVFGPTVHALSADLGDRRALRNLVSRVAPSTVVHLAARVSGPDTAEVMLENVETTDNLLNACSDARVRRFVFASSVSVYPPQPADGVAHGEDDPLAPIGAYGESKRHCEDLVRQWSEQGGRTSVILRFSGIHGPPRKSGVVHHFVKAAATGTTIKVDEPNAVFSMLFIEDAAGATIRATEAPLPVGANVFNVAGAESMSLSALARHTNELAGGGSAFECGSAPPRNSAMAIQKSRSHLGYEPTATVAALGRLVESYRHAC